MFACARQTVAARGYGNATLLGSFIQTNFMILASECGYYGIRGYARGLVQRTLLVIISASLPSSISTAMNS